MRDNSLKSEGLPSGGPLSYVGWHQFYHESQGRMDARGYRKKVISRFIIPPYVDAYTRLPFLDEDA
ncbi:hypothetical protein C9E91_11650 [Rhizobium sp. SEMIA4064]|nr:hypothetical protein C9E91_11650 [Rhizobium sp. SEMIA4064]